MKELNELSFPDDLRYTEDHEWAKADGDRVKIGITDYAQDQLGDIVFVELPEIGSTYAKGDEFGSVESVKAVSEIYLPVGGEVLTVNEALDDAAELVNSDPYNEGWLIEIKPKNPDELGDLMDKEAYLAMLKRDE